MKPLFKVDWESANKRVNNCAVGLAEIIFMGYYECVGVAHMASDVFTFIAKRITFKTIARITFARRNVTTRVETRKPPVNPKVADNHYVACGSSRRSLYPNPPALACRFALEPRSRYLARSSGQIAVDAGVNIIVYEQPERTRTRLNRGVKSDSVFTSAFRIKPARSGTDIDVYVARARRIGAGEKYAPSRGRHCTATAVTANTYAADRSQVICVGGVTYGRSPKNLPPRSTSRNRSYSSGYLAIDAVRVTHSMQRNHTSYLKILRLVCNSRVVSHVVHAFPDNCSVSHAGSCCYSRSCRQFEPHLCFRGTFGDNRIVKSVRYGKRR